MTDPNSEPAIASLPRPRELMERMHPDLFPDSTSSARVALDSDFFGYQLETLTARGQECEFEDFCRAIAQRELCPNLRPQTGPTGGGDSKVDSETYAVAPEISDRWWIGDPAAGSERWAFAFSAKKEWKAKVRSDVANIVSTERRYRRIYFVTNQFARDKDRAALEDELSRSAECRVTILDRTWLVEKVFDNGHEELAARTLRLSGYQQTVEEDVGPRDHARRRRLEAIDAEVADPDAFVHQRYRLAEASLEAAILARNLGRPRSEIEARLTAARRYADDLGYDRQVRRIIYHTAWTAHWWFEDFGQFRLLYEELDELLGDTADVDDIEQLQTLWSLIVPRSTDPTFGFEADPVHAGARRLTGLLQPIVEDPTRPNAALQARTLLAFSSLMIAMHDGSAEFEPVWTELSNIVDLSETHPFFDVRQIGRRFEAIGAALDDPKFEQLQDHTVELIAKRGTVGEAGETFMRRATAKLDRGKPFEAIVWFGKAERALAFEETRTGLVRALIGGSLAHEAAGLLWGARNKALAACERQAHFVLDDDEERDLLGRLLRRLFQLELQLGRLPRALEAWRAHCVCRSVTEGTVDEEQLDDALVAISTLRIPEDERGHARRLPDVLGTLNLHFASTAAFYLLGATAELHQVTGEEKIEQGIQELFSLLLSQPASRQIPERTELCERERCVLRSTILGTLIEYDVPTEPDVLFVTEAFAGALESLLATSGELIFGTHSAVDVHVEHEGAELRLIWEEHDDPILRVPFRPARTVKEQREQSEQLQEALVSFAVHGFAISDPERWLKNVFLDEEGIARTLASAPLPAMVSSLFGSDPIVGLSALLPDSATNYDLSTPLSIPHHERGADRTEDEEAIDGIRHDRMTVLSPIRQADWNAAHWQGAGYAFGPGIPPVMLLLFENHEAGERIFRNWRETWSQDGSDAHLRILIVRGVDRTAPTHYRMTIGPRMDHLSEGDGRWFNIVTRAQTMEPETNVNLDGFLEGYREAGQYVFGTAPRSMRTLHDVSPHILVRNELVVRDAWTIGPHDEDLLGLRPDDDPIVPDDVAAPPVVEALRQMRERRSFSLQAVDAIRRMAND